MRTDKQTVHWPIKEGACNKNKASHSRGKSISFGIKDVGLETAGHLISVVSLPSSLWSCPAKTLHYRGNTVYSPLTVFYYNPVASISNRNASCDHRETLGDRQKRGRESMTGGESNKTKRGSPFIPPGFRLCSFDGAYMGRGDSNMSWENRV